MVKLVRIGLSCCEGDVKKRPDLKQALERIEEMKIVNDDKESYADDDFSSIYSEGGVGGVRRPSTHLSADFDNHPHDSN